MYLFCAFLCLFADIRQCGIPLGFWLAGVWCLNVFDMCLSEVSDRMKNSVFWDLRRRSRKWILLAAFSTKLLTEMTWYFWGAIMYFSSESDGCSDKNFWLVFLMVFILILAALKILAMLFYIGMLCYICFLN